MTKLHDTLTKVAKKANEQAEVNADNPNKATRDWSGFFAALASFISAVTPVITNLFAEQPADADKPS